MCDSFRLLDLPPELLVHVLSFLPLDTFVACQETSRLLRNTICESIELQYLIATLTAGVIDNPAPGAAHISVAQRLEMLLAREDAFDTITPSWECTVPVPFNSSGLYELSCGFFFLGDEPRTALWYFELPTEEPPKDQPPHWKRIAPLSPINKIIDFGLAIAEHDLIVFATFTQHEETNREDGLVKLEFLSMSTHLTHPEAHGPIEVHSSTWGAPSVSLEIVGNHLVFPQDRVYMFNWRTGELEVQVDAESGSYSAAIFLSPEVLLLPNTIAGRLELWNIAPGQTAPALSLRLPRLAQDERLRYITARAEPNPSVSGNYYHSRTPFHPSADGAIIIISKDALAMRSLLFIHRHTLLALLAAHPTGSTFPYAEWGPDICPLDPSERHLLGLDHNDPFRAWPTDQAPLLMLDFNMSTDQHPHVVDPQDDPFADTDAWAEPVGSRLECTLVRSTEKYKYDGASLDAERIIGFRRNLHRRVIAVDVLYLGAGGS
ncbi:hypothetical protein C8J57DRAFT_1271436 [Mycena rebaudengoi]|nr:hypothetical protein C8J57DRAFT_1271436 [Mycena rebaudengoi]